MHYEIADVLDKMTQDVVKSIFEKQAQNNLCHFFINSWYKLEQITILERALLMMGLPDWHYKVILIKQHVE